MDRQKAKYKYHSQSEEYKHFFFFFSFQTTLINWGTQNAVQQRLIEISQKKKIKSVS